MRNDVVGRFEPLDDLKAAGLLHEHTLARIVRVADSDHKPIRHPPNELALIERDRHKLAAGRIRALAEEIQPSLFNTPDSPFVHLPVHGLDQRCLALELVFLMCYHNSSPPVPVEQQIRRTVATRSNRLQGRTWRRSSVPRLRPAAGGNKGVRFSARDALGRRVSSCRERLPDLAETRSGRRPSCASRSPSLPTLGGLPVMWVTTRRQ